MAGHKAQNVQGHGIITY